MRILFKALILSLTLLFASTAMADAFTDGVRLHESGQYDQSFAIFKNWLPKGTKELNSALVCIMKKDAEPLKTMSELLIGIKRQPSRV